MADAYSALESAIDNILGLHRLDTKPGSEESGHEQREFEVASWLGSHATAYPTSSRQVPAFGLAHQDFDRLEQHHRQLDCKPCEH
jgi:hypothetical protein